MDSFSQTAIESFPGTNLASIGKADHSHQALKHWNYDIQYAIACGKPGLFMTSSNGKFLSRQHVANSILYMLQPSICVFPNEPGWYEASNCPIPENWISVTVWFGKCSGIHGKKSSIRAFNTWWYVVSNRPSEDNENLSWVASNEVLHANLQLFYWMSQTHQQGKRHQLQFVIFLPRYSPQIFLLILCFVQESWSLHRNICRNFHKIQSLWYWLKELS